MLRQAQGPTWNKESGYIYVMLGSAIGFGNILTFSGHCYRNGGGAFMLPYLLVLLLMALPLLFLESFLGKTYRKPITTCFALAQGKKWRFFGWFSVLTCFTIGAIYIVISGYSGAYALFSALGNMREATDLFFKDEFLSVSGQLTELGGFSYKVGIASAIVVLLTWWVLHKNIRRGLESFCSFFLPLLFTLLVLFVLLIFVLPGSIEGVVHLFQVDMSRLASPFLWRDVIGQSFFSLSLGLGIVTGLSRYTTNETNLPRAMFAVAFGDFFVSVLASIAIFGCLGFIADVNGMQIGELIHLESVYELGFVVFPKIMLTLGGGLSQFIGFLFFFCLFIAGTTGLFAILEAVIGNVVEEFPISRHRALMLVLIGCSLLAIPLCMGNGLYLMQVIEPMLMGDAVLIGGIVEIVVFLYLSKEIKHHPIWQSSMRSKYAYMILRSVTLTLLLMGLGGALAAEIRTGFHLAEAIRWGWFFVVLLLAGIITLFVQPMTMRKYEV